MKFIYVFCKDAADTLAANGYKLLKTDENGSYYIFKNKQEVASIPAKPTFSLDVSYIFSDTLTF